jgi:hypothetical protein
MQDNPFSNLIKQDVIIPSYFQQKNNSKRTSLPGDRTFFLCIPHAKLRNDALQMVFRMRYENEADALCQFFQISFCNASKRDQSIRCLLC